MKEFITSYGTILTIISSWTLVLIGWAIVFNGTKYIASRNESRSILSELSRYIEVRFNESIEFWSIYDKDKIDKIKEKTYFKKNALAISRIKSCNLLLERYGLQVIDKKDFIAIKKVLTLSPDNELLKSYELFEAFRENKILSSNRLCNEVLTSINLAFIDLHPPVKKPILDTLFKKIELKYSFLSKKLNYIKPYFMGLLFSTTIISTYFYIGSLIYPIK